MLEIKDLSKTYNNGVEALKNINLTIPKGMFGLLGPNGAGKSSLMRTLATLQAADTGEVSLNGVDVLNDKHSTRQTLGYLPQNFGLYPQMSATELLNHFAILKGISDKRERIRRVTDMLAVTNLYEKRNHAVGTFSGGMRQRFGIAQALIGSPSLLIVDEPTAGLDPTERNRFHNLLVSLSDDMIVVLSTHIVEDVGDLCPNMAIMNRGTVLTQGTPTELKRALQGKIWAKQTNAKELQHYQQTYSVISTRLTEGRSELHIYSESSQGDRFVEVDADLEDVYFSTLYLADENMKETTG